MNDNIIKYNIINLKPLNIFEQYYYIFLELCKHYCSTCSIIQNSVYNKERTVLANILSTITSQTQSLLYIGHRHYFKYTSSNVYTPNSTLQSLLSHTTTFGERLWKHLSLPLPPETRLQIITFITLLDKFIEKFIINHPKYMENNSLLQFQKPKSPCKPSLTEQVHLTTITIDPYQLSLQKNYYYPISSFENMEASATTDTSALNTNPVNNPPSNQTAPTTPKTITVEDSLDAIDDLINEFTTDIDEDEIILDQDVSLELPQAVPTTNTVNNIRFSLFPKRSTKQYQNVSESLPQIKTLFKNILHTHSSTKILTIRDDNPVFPIRTTDQINNLSMVGTMNYFKSSRSALKSLAGDYHISTALSFDDFKAHTKISSWLGLNGYNIIYHECQTSDMVLVGFLTRVRSFTWRDDLKSDIMATDQWKAAPFFFRLYPGTLSSNLKSAMSPILLVEVDRPKIEIGINFFKEVFDNENKVSSCSIAYPFFCLYKNRLSNEERFQIINDSKQHTENISIIHIAGIKNIDVMVTLKQNVQVKLRKLLLSLRAPGQPTQKLFIQVEKQNDPEWITCAFHTTDAESVLQKLPTLSSLIQQYIVPSSITDVFTSPDNKLRFVTKSIPVKKGNIQVAYIPISEETQQHTCRMLSKIALANKNKRVATAHPGNDMSKLIQKHQQVQEASSLKTANTLHYTPFMQLSGKENSPPLTLEKPVLHTDQIQHRFAILEDEIQKGSERMASIEDLCRDLKQGQDRMNHHLELISRDLYDSPSRSGKFSKTNSEGSL